MSWTVKQACTIVTARRDTLHRRLGFCCRQAVCGKCSALHFPGPSPSDRPTCLRLSLASRRLKHSFRNIYTLSCVLVKWAIGVGVEGSPSQIACANGDGLRSLHIPNYKSNITALLSHAILNEWIAFYSAFWIYTQSGYGAIWLLHGWCHVKLLPSRRTYCVHHTTMHQFTLSFCSKPHT